MYYHIQFVMQINNRLGLNKINKTLNNIIKAVKTGFSIVLAVGNTKLNINLSI